MSSVRITILTWLMLIDALQGLHSKEQKPEFFSGCPIIELKGQLIRYTFPGPPNYSDVVEGDTPCSRWALYLDDKEIDQLLLEGKLTQDDIDSSEWKRLIRLICDGDKTTGLYGKEVVVKGYLGSLDTYGFTPFQIEVINIDGYR